MEPVTLKQYQFGCEMMRDEALERVFFAFNDEQFNKGLKEHPELEEEQLRHVIAGGYTDDLGVFELKEFNRKRAEFMEYAKMSDKFVHDFILHHLADYEFHISGDPLSVIMLLFDELGVSYEMTDDGLQVEKNKRIISIYNNCIDEYKKMCEEW